MEPSFITTGKHLLMRYKTGGSFSFDSIRSNAPNEGIFNLASAIASIQEQQPTGVYSVVTRIVTL